MSDSFLSRFIGGTLSVGAGNLSVMVLGLLGVMVVARYLPAETFGAFVLIQVIATFLTRVSSLGLDLAVAKFIAGTEDLGERRRLVNTTLYFRLLLFPAVAGLAWLIKPALAMLFDISMLETLFIYVVILYLFTSLSQILKSMLQGLFLFNVIAKTDVVASVLGFILILGLILIFDYGLLGLIYAKLISLGVAIVFAYVSIPVKKRLEFDVGALKGMLRFGFPLQINDVLTFFFLRIDTLMIGALLGPAEIAYYEIARKIPESLSGLYEAFRSVFYPFISKLFAQGDLKDATKMLNHSLRLISFVTILGALVALVFGNEIIQLLFSARYLSSVPAFVLLMIGINLTFIDYTLGYSLVAVGDSDKPAYINVIHSSVSLLGNFVLIPMIGIVGAALAGIAGFAVANPLNLFFLRRRNVEAGLAVYLKPILIFAGYGLLYLFLIPSLWIAKGAILLLFLLTCLLFSVIRLDDFATGLRESKVILFKLLRRPSSQSTSI